jgi:CubicO group peptidase (beta-lactamase class C family)
MLANGGELDGARLVSPYSIERFSRPRAHSAEGLGYSLGYHRLTGTLRIDGVAASAFGHSGAGGYLGFADPRHRVAFGFVKNRMLPTHETATELAGALYRCLRR